MEFVNSPRLRNEHPVVRALLAHFFLVTIHPFGDGNGRVSRLVEAAILYEGGYNVYGFYGLSNYFYRNGDDYKRRLQECRRVQPFNLAPFVEFGLRGFDAELLGINRFIKTKLNRLVYRNTLTHALGMRVSKRRHLYVMGAYREVTPRTFIREIRRLSDLGFISLEVDPESGRELVGIDFNAIEIDFGEMASY